ncbi:MAG: hypothetical protein WCF03_17310 [Nitrososphaeraceae archaeon]
MFTKCLINVSVPSDALLLKRQFGLETVWDHPENNIVGPKEVDIEIDKILLEQDKPATTTKPRFTDQ